MNVKINGIKKHFRTVWMKGNNVFMINQPLLPHKFKIFKCKTYLDTVEAIKDMTVRGAGAIGATAGYAMCQAALESAKLRKPMKYLFKAANTIKDSRPTAQNLFYAVDRVCDAMLGKETLESAVEAAVLEANAIADDDAEACKKIGELGNTLLGSKDSVLTHCNAGWLAFVDYGSALSPVYAAKAAGKKIIVYSDETRPRLQGANLTAWELLNEGIEHYVIPDNAAGAFMKNGRIGIVIVGADRIANNGDTANKIGTYEKAICARAAGIPFYVAAPSSTFDVKCRSGRDIPIEYRSEDEVHWVYGITEKRRRSKVRVTPEGSRALNPAFDVTPAEYISGFITEKGIIFNENKGFDFEKLWK
ncbi:MAG: S-methyl-5-thioribose-1-phosphate isomerase [Candidatus Nanoarchaeia archaeon]|nr:S-methyl-5-thioribose-1-phosphate isomerase [Candidatus Nanoarchaeia archaeon]